jgi:chromosome segregation ATPase
MSALPTASDYTAEELEEKLQELNQKYQNADNQFKEMSEKKDAEHRNLAEIQENHENITKKMELKKDELDFLTDKIAQEQSKRHEVQQQVPKLTKKSSQLNDDIQRYQDRLDELLRTHPKVGNLFSSSSLLHLFEPLEIENTKNNHSFCSRD